MASSSKGDETQAVKGDDQIPKWVREMSNKQKQAVENAPSPCYIFKVPSKLRVGGLEKFEPRVVSIGPYHRKLMEITENTKEMFVHALISRTTTQLTSTTQDLLISMWKEIIKVKDDCLNCYLPKPDLEDEAFVKMLILDGCYIIELLYRYRLEPSPNNWIYPCLQQDLVLLENQIPFLVLEILFDLLPCVTIPDTTEEATTLVENPREQEMDTLIQHSSSPQVFSLRELILHFFDPILPTTDKTSTDYFSTTTPDKHLLDLLRTHLLQEDGTDKKAVVGDDPYWEHTNSVTDLQNAGVTFKEKEKNKGLLDITFYNETLEIPAFHFGKSWATLFLNMIALEQCRRDYADKITSYAILMDNLINSSNDVKLLKEGSIISGSKEEDMTVADIVNSLSKEAIYENFYYDLVCNNLNNYCKKKTKRWRAAFYQNYIHTPWAGVSLIGALILLLLALIQTVFTILSWKLAYDDMRSKKLCACAPKA